jgi:hypothetical protein
MDNENTANSKSTKTFYLAAPIEVGEGKTIAQLDLKVPKFGTFVRYGMPFMSVLERDSNDDNWEYSCVNVKPILSFIAESAGVDRDVVQKIAGHNVMPLFNTMVGLLAEKERPKGDGFVLTSPIRTHNGEVSSLKLKSPTVETFETAGIPYVRVRKVDDNSRDVAEFRFDPRIMIAFVSAMTGIDSISLEEIDGRDVLPLFFEVVHALGN